MAAKSRTTSFLLSKDCRSYLSLLAGRLGVTRTAVIEFAVRELAEKKNIILERSVSDEQSSKSES